MGCTEPATDETPATVTVMAFNVQNLFDNVDDLNDISLLPGRTWLEIPRNLEGTVAWS